MKLALENGAQNTDRELGQMDLTKKDEEPTFFTSLGS
jgi:hypothetical protein